MDSATLATIIEEFILSAPAPAVIEGGEILFDFAEARYSIASENGRCLLHLWSAERNCVRRIVSAEVKPSALRLKVQRFGKAEPTILEILRTRERRSASSLKAAREEHRRFILRLIERQWPEWRCESFTTATDLASGFGPAFCRGMLRRGHTGWACVSVGPGETQAMIDGALGIGLLWLDHLRETYAGTHVLEGLKVIVPVGTSQVVRLRSSQLNHELAKMEVWEFDERDFRLVKQDIHDIGNVLTTLSRCPDRERLLERFSKSLSRVREYTADFEIKCVHSSELSLRLRGLEFAKIRGCFESSSLTLGEEIVFGIGAASMSLDDATEPLFRDLIARIEKSRARGFAAQNPIWRAQPERWLESLLARDIQVLDRHLSPSPVYAQVPAFSASDRAVIDLLGVTAAGRLAVIEVKAEDDLQLPLQGLDYWFRVKQHHERGDFHRYGYFPGRLLSPEPPILFLVAPALHLHPSTDRILQFLSPKIDCRVAGVDERWRQELRVVFRKRNRRSVSAEPVTSILG